MIKKPKLVFHDFQQERFFTVAPNDFNITEIPQEFLDKYQNDMNEYCRLEDEMKKIIRKKVELLQKLKFEFSEIYSPENTPQYYL
jgi:hypothetical protein